MLPDDYSEPEKLGNIKGGVGGNGNLRPATPGEVRNPKGRGLGVKNRATIAKELLSVQLNGEGLDGVSGKYSAEYLVNAALLKKAMAGDVSAFKELHDTVYGKISDTVDMNHSGSIKSERELSDADRALIELAMEHKIKGGKDGKVID